MNAERRKAIAAVISKLEELASQLGEIKDDLETIRDEEQEYYDNMPESFQNGDKGERAQAAIDALEGALNDLPEDFQDVIGNLEEAQQ